MEWKINATIHFAELTDMTDFDYIRASSRLNNPVQSYTKENDIIEMAFRYKRHIMTEK